MKVTIKALDRSREWPRLYWIRLGDTRVAYLIVTEDGRCKVVQQSTINP